MVTSISNSPEETLALGACWGRELTAGWVIALSGDLGAGKTQLVKGLAQGLGIPGRVHSPTFALLNEYRGGRVPLFHLDLYRLGGPADVASAGLEEYLPPVGGAVVVEWAERWFGSAVPPLGAATRLRRVSIEILDACRRRISHEDSGV